MLNLKIRKATETDYDSYIELFEKNFKTSASMSRQYYQNIITSRFLYFAELDNQIVGMIYCFLWNHKQYNTVCEIQNLCVIKEYRQLGIATELIRYSINEISRFCNYFELIDGSGGITEIIARKLKFSQHPSSKQTFILPIKNV